MKKVFIKYNPYKLETEFIVEGKGLAQNSKIGERILPGSHLQEWVEELPELLLDEYNDRSFDIEFHGTLMDFEDLIEVFSRAEEAGTLTAKFNHIPARETADKEKMIDEVFQKIQNGPFEELKDEEIINAFQHAKSSDFEVCVVATMSSGKSTLINSMLGTKLMPAKQEACTAIITKIKDTENSDVWEAEVYGKDQKLMESHTDLTYATMERLNSNEAVSTIKVTGNIPFVSAEDVSLVLIDTPGPNNSRDPEHKRIQSEFLNKSSKSLVLYIMTPTFGSDDDNALLQRVADSMKVGGKQSKDRFIFVVNKLDDCDPDEDNPAVTLNKIRDYLKKHGVAEPNLFLAAALPALNIRLIQSGVQVNPSTIKKTNTAVEILNETEPLHLETYAPLPESVRNHISKKLNEAKLNNDALAEALIHSGVVSIEAAIRQYVQKYAKTAKIKNIADTFTHKLDEVGCFEQTKKELAQNREDGERIAQQLSVIRQKVDDAKDALQFKAAIELAVKDVEENAGNIINTIYEKYMSKIAEKSDSLEGKEIDEGMVALECLELKKFCERLEPEFQNELNNFIQENLIMVSNALLQEYKKKIAALTSELGPDTFSGITIDPLELIKGSIPKVDGSSVNGLLHSKTVKDGEEWVANTDKKWYKPWTWLQEDGYYKAKYKTVKYVPGKDLAQLYFMPIESNLLDNSKMAKDHALKLSQHIAGIFNEKFEQLDSLLKQKLSELESYASDREQAEKRIKETEERLAWLETIKNDIENILEI